VRLLLAPFALFRRRPLRALAALLLLMFIAGAVGLVGLFLWHAHHLRAARLAVELGHNSAAIEHLRLCRLFRPDDPEVLLLSARVARRGGAWDEAETLLDQYWHQRGVDDALVLERLLLAATRGEIESNQTILQRLIDRKDVSAPLAREALIAGLLYRHRLVETGSQIEHWLQHDPDSTMALLYRGRLDEARFQNTDALASYRRVLELDPEHDEARLRLTTVLLELSQGEEALPHLQYLRRRLPGNPTVPVQLANALDLLGRTDGARAILDECLDHHPDNAVALTQRGRIALRDGDGELAEKHLARAVRLDPGDRVARHQYSLALSRNGKTVEAAEQEKEKERLEADLERLNELLRGRLQQVPNDAEALHEVAIILLRAGRPREAHRWLQNAVQADPNHGPTHQALAIYYREAGNPILAARHRAIARRLAGQKRTKQDK
jgi:tetratricopeptide (TPR) repeat protein